jgi:carboxypeptidase Q
MNIRAPRHKLFLSLLAVFSLISCFAQKPDDATIKTIFDEALSNGKSYQMLEQLTQTMGPRLSGSAGAAEAVEWSEDLMRNLNFDSVWLQPVMVPHWVRGQKEIAYASNSKNERTILTVCALGGSVGTGPQGVSGSVIEVKGFDELKELGIKNIQGKIVFFNRPMDPTEINTFNAYAGAVNQRAFGASEAAKFGAIGMMVRSMGLNPEDYPHTGGLRYDPTVPKIPAVALSTRHADMLSTMIREKKDLIAYFETHCEMFEDAPSFNVVGEIKGGEYADEIIVVGGHLDSWDLAQGAHDDGTGCVQAIETLRLFRAIGYKPIRTIRVVLFMNEENGLRGGLQYAALSAQNKEKHIAAIESDRGGFTPRGFAMSGSENSKVKVRSWKPLLEPYGLTDFSQDGAGADVEPLKAQGVLVMDFLPDSQRYFEVHHTPADTFDKVSKRELEMGAASMAALTFLLDKYGLSK